MNELWKKVVDNANAARLLLANEHYDAASTRAYFAMFTAARVLLKEIVEIDLEETKRHKAALRLFSQHFVNPRAFPREFGRVLNRSSQIRATADYSTTFVTENEAHDLIDTMEQFITLAERLLSDHKTR